MVKASFAAGICFPRGFVERGGILPQDELLFAHIVAAFVSWFSAASAVDRLGLLGLTVFSMPAACWPL
jgi:hypothetical protein